MAENVWLTGKLAERGLTRRDLEQVAPQPTVSSWLRNTRRVGPGHLLRLAEFLGVSEREILQNVGPGAVGRPASVIPPGAVPLGELLAEGRDAALKLLQVVERAERLLEGEAPEAPQTRPRRRGARGA